MREMEPFLNDRFGANKSNNNNIYNYDDNNDYESEVSKRTSELEFYDQVRQPIGKVGDDDDSRLLSAARICALAHAR